MVRGLVLISENRAANNAADAAKADQSGRTKSSLPLASDVVGLPGKNAGDVRVTSSDCKEYAKVSNANVVGVAKKSDSYPLLARATTRVLRMTDQASRAVH